MKDRVLVVENDVPVREAIAEFFRRSNYEVIATGTCVAAEQLLRSTRPDAAILDYSLPDGNALELIPRLKAIEPMVPLVILTAYGSIDLAVEAVKLGAEHFLTKPAELGALLLVIQRCVEIHRERRKHIAERNLQRRKIMNPFIGTSEAITRLAESAGKVLSSEGPILIQGETGTGKGVLAHWLHENGPRSAAPFVDLNCSALDRNLLEAELFGHDRGTLPGAMQNKIGLLEIAHKGIVFLDEIGDVDPQVQPRLLKVLEEKQFRRLGDVRDRMVDVRLIASTHHDMAKRVRDKSFRSDLYFRINADPLRTPSLRERVEDIPAIATDILGALSRELGTGSIEVSPGAMRVLQVYAWPGNIRELRNVLERAVLLNGNRILTERDLHFDSEADTNGGSQPAVKTLETVERQYIEEVLYLEGGRVEQAARTLGIPRSSLYHKIKQYGISRPGASMAH
ncbi:MAG TPA: sigma-54 dependent transcriptional regulator [Terriglobales bacterium]|nr:sigma-54 dependent transcriptional regulator [Terriglobales bacterium]